MISAIGSSTPYTPPHTNAGGLQAQLDRYQKQLSDCVNCDSANTHEGKETIQALSNKISDIRARIQETEVVSSNSRSTAINSATSAASSTSSVPPATDTQRQGNAVATVASATSATTPGSRLSVFS